MPGKLVRTESSVGTAIRLFSFGSLDRVLDAAHLLSPMYHGVNTCLLYTSHTRIIDAIRNKNLKKLEKLLVEQQKVTIDEFDFSGCYCAKSGLALLD